jgi:hypothetical protein
MWRRACDFGLAGVVASRANLNDESPIGKDHAMGDKGGKKDKDKSKKQKAMKQEQMVKGKQDKNRPK